MAAYLLETVPARVVDDNGDPVPGALLHTYEAGTTTPLATYTNAVGNVQLDNPIEADADGMWPQIWVSNEPYKLVANEADDATLLWQRDNVVAVGAVGANVLEMLADTTDLDLGDALIGVKADIAGAAARTQHDVNAERVSIRDFGALGDGTDQTAALLAAIAYANDNYSTSNYKHQIFLPAGDYLFDLIELQSLRGITFVGEGTMDPTRRKTRWAYGGPGAEDAALVIRSCAYLKFIGILFDLNSAENMGNLVRFVANESTASLPLNRFSNNWITFEDCVFYVQPAITTKPAATVWAKSCSSTVFRRCGIYCGDTTSLKLGADTDVDPDTGNPTFANGLCVITAIDDCYISGDIQREKSYLLRITDTQFAVRSDVTTVNSRLTISGGGLTFNELIENNIWDRSGVTTFTGVLIEGGTHADSSGLTVRGNQLDGRLTLIRVNRGDAFASGNRPIAYGGGSPNRFVSIASTAKNVVVQSNNEDGYLSANLVGVAPIARMLYDERTSKFGPVITASELATAVTLPAAGAYQSLLSTTHKFGGGYVRINYSVCVLHKEAATTRAYTTRVLVDGVLVAGTVRRSTATAAGGAVEDQVTIAMGHVVYIDATDEAVTIELQAAQASGGGPYGIVQGADTVARTSWAVELITH